MHTRLMTLFRRNSRMYLFTRFDPRSPGNWRKVREEKHSLFETLHAKRERERGSKKRQTNLAGRNAVHPSARVSCVNT